MQLMRNLFLFILIVLFLNSKADLTILKNSDSEQRNLHYCKNSNCKKSENIKNLNLPDLQFTVMPLGKVNPGDLEEAKTIIKNFFGFNCKLGRGRDIAEKMYYKGEAETLDVEICINQLAIQKNKVVYIVDKKLIFGNQMLRGAALRDGDVAIVRGERSFLRETLIHEIGHLLGLTHCSEVTCIMALNNDEQDSGTFCNNCSRSIGFNNPKIINKD
jgi:predicted Zn-dependent protease